MHQALPHAQRDQQGSDREHANIADDADVAKVHVPGNSAPQPGEGQKAAEEREAPCPTLSPVSVQSKGEEDEDRRRDPVELVGPYARIRIVVAVIVMVFAVAVIAFRAFFG